VSHADIVGFVMAAHNMESVMNDQATCGRGLAAHAAFPSVVGDVMSSMADVLAHHMTALDLGDPNTRAEYEAYGALVEAHRASAEQLRSISLRMAGSRDLPMGRHDEAVMGSADGAGRFASLVRHEQALHTLLGSTLAEHRALSNQ
jgi:hypothetical protein